MNPSFRTRLRSNEALIGTIISLPSPAIAEILVEAGFDWLFIDLEHSAMDAGDAQAILQAVAGRAGCMVRVPLNDEIWIKKALDAGADGIIVPQVNTMEEAQRAVRFSKYPPQGTRSVGIGRAHGYGGRFNEYVAQANGETVVMVQVEHVRAVENLEQILTVEGIDAVFIGPYDLSASMDLVGQLDHPQVQAALGRVREVCLAHKMPLAIFTVSAERVETYLGQGFTLIALSGDTLMLGEAARGAVDSWQAAVRADNG
jgi:2-dehydro-3-deoxyglucarate aldolase